MAEKTTCPMSEHSLKSPFGGGQGGGLLTILDYWKLSPVSMAEKTTAARSNYVSPNTTNSFRPQRGRTKGYRHCVINMESLQDSVPGCNTASLKDAGMFTGKVTRHLHAYTFTRS